MHCVRTKLVSRMIRKKCIAQLLTWTQGKSLVEQMVTAYGKADSVKIRSVENTDNILKEIISSGPQSLQVITDFNSTLTRYHLNGRRCELSSYGIIVHSPLVSPKVKADAEELLTKYYPIEMSTEMSTEQKAPYMIEWYEKSHQSLLTSSPRINRSQVAEMARNAQTVFRENAEKLLESLHTANIPVVILSAGMGNLVVDLLKLNSVNYPNLKVIANFMEFDELGELKGFSRPLIHDYNKNEAAIHDTHSGYFEDLKKRNNVILMGDSLGDTNMASGVKDLNAIVKIGFLNENVEKQLNAYMDQFDVVLVDDQSMDFVNMIMDVVITK